MRIFECSRNTSETPVFNVNKQFYVQLHQLRCHLYIYMFFVSHSSNKFLWRPLFGKMSTLFFGADAQKILLTWNDKNFDQNVFPMTKNVDQYLLCKSDWDFRFSLKCRMHTSAKLASAGIFPFFSRSTVIAIFPLPILSWKSIWVILSKSSSSSSFLRMDFKDGLVSPAFFLPFYFSILT